jgi:hypothetical protein
VWLDQADNSRMIPVRTLMKFLGTLLLMAVCGAAAFAGMLAFLMKLGLKRHDSYEYYGGNLGLILTFGAAAVGFLVPGLIVWCLSQREIRWQFSLRSLLIAMTLVALLLGIVAFLLFA